MHGLNVKNLSKHFGGLTVAQDITFDLPPGSRKALIGPNGAGKSTVANLITGLLSPSSGQVCFDGCDISGLSEARRVKIGLAKTFQITTLFPRLTVRENLRLALIERQGRGFDLFKPADASPEIEEEIDNYLLQFNLADRTNWLVCDLAYGQQRLVEMALTLALRPRVLILDEPAAGVPSSETHLIIDAIEYLPPDLAVLIIEHDMDLVFQVATSIIVLVQGRILIEGPPEQITADAKVRELYLGNGHG